MSIPTDIAAWIRTAVLPTAYRTATGDLARCPCQWGLCGWCEASQHDRCTATTCPPQASPDTYITSAHGYVWPGHGIPVAVWRSGTPCRWVCPCTCRTTAPPLIPAPPRTGRRSDGYLRIAATDTTYRAVCQPSLLDALTGEDR